MEHINRYIVECKAKEESALIPADCDINRYIVECKGEFHTLQHPGFLY